MAYGIVWSEHSVVAVWKGASYLLALLCSGILGEDGAESCKTRLVERLNETSQVVLSRGNR
jgi:hypothetical protein